MGLLGSDVLRAKHSAVTATQRRKGPGNLVVPGICETRDEGLPLTQDQMLLSVMCWTPHLGLDLGLASCHLVVPSSPPSTCPMESTQWLVWEELACTPYSSHLLPS